jgi:hypothetical protein
MPDHKYFKFHDAAFTESMMCGKWLISSLDYFSYREIKEADQWIGDHTESSVIYKVDGTLSWESGNVPPEDQYMRQEGLINGPITGNSISDVTFAPEQWPGHIISLSYGDYDSCAQAMMIESDPAYRYNACIEISDIAGFAAALWEEGVTNSGTPLNKLFKEPLIDKIIYADREGMVSEQKPLHSGYFYKRPIYEKQKEHRIVFPHVNKWAIRDRIFFTLPRPERFLTVRHTEAPVKKVLEPQSEPDLMILTKLLYGQLMTARAMDNALRPWPPVRNETRSAEIMNFVEGMLTATDPNKYSTDNYETMIRIRDEGTAEALSSIKNQRHCEDTNSTMLRDLLWRWRLEKGMRLKSRIAYLFTPKMHFLEDLYAALTIPYQSHKLVHMLD